jgi:hypothetical protein
VYFQQLRLKDLFVSNEMFTFAQPKMVFFSRRKSSVSYIEQYRNMLYGKRKKYSVQVVATSVPYM